MQKLVTTDLPTPSKEECQSIWQNAHISVFPTWSDRQYYRAQALYTHLGLDWRNPDHKSHVASIVARHGESRPDCRETND